jgi:hypothetical protein
LLLTISGWLPILCVEVLMVARIFNSTCLSLARPSDHGGVLGATASLFGSGPADQPSSGLSSGMWNEEGKAP